MKMMHEDFVAGDQMTTARPLSSLMLFTEGWSNEVVHLLD